MFSAGFHSFYPDLLFLASLVENKENLKKSKDLLSQSNPLEFLRRKGKNSNQQGIKFLGKVTSKEIKKNKE